MSELSPRLADARITWRSLVADVLVDVEVVLARARPRAIDSDPVEREVAEVLGIVVLEPDRARHRGLNRVVLAALEHVPGALLGRIGCVVAVGDGVRQPAGGADDRDSAVRERDQLRQPAGLEHARHHQQV